MAHAAHGFPSNRARTMRSTRRATPAHGGTFMSRLVPAVAVLILVVAPGCGALRGSAPDVKSARLLDGLGSHTRPITTRDPLAQRWFDQGLRLAYGFNHTEAQIAFEECTRVDPTAAMCWWGVAY